MKLLLMFAAEKVLRLLVIPWLLNLFLFQVNIHNKTALYWKSILIHVDSTSVRSNDIHLRAISQVIPQPAITQFTLEITYLEFHLILPGTYGLICVSKEYPILQLSSGIFADNSNCLHMASISCEICYSIDHNGFVFVHTFECCSTGLNDMGECGLYQPQQNATKLV